MQAGDTAAAGVTETDRHRMCGNAFAVGWIASMLWPWIRNHTRTLRQLACRSPAGTVCGLLASNAEIQANSTYTTEGGAGASPTILQRLRTTALTDAKYQDLVHTPGSNYLSKDGLLFVTRGEHQAVVIPGDNALRQDLLHLVHDRAHFGVTRTYLSTLRHFCWAGIRGHIKHFVARSQLANYKSLPIKNNINSCSPKLVSTLIHFIQLYWMWLRICRSPREDTTQFLQ